VTTSTAAPAASAPRLRRDARIARLRHWGLPLMILALLVFFGLTQPAFASVANAFGILKSIAVITVIACAATLSMAVDGFDLSVGTNAGLAMMLSAIAMVVWQQGVLVAVGVALVGGAAIGLFNALLIVGLRVPDLLATLATLFVVQGFQLVITGGRSVSTGMSLGDGQVASGAFDPAFLWLGRGSIGPVPVPVLLMLVVVLLLHGFLMLTRHGRAMYATGANREASRLAGIRVDRYRALAYVGAGMLASFGGVLLAAQVGRGDVGSGNPYLLDAVAATLIGFAAFNQHRANAIGTLLGAVFLGVILNGLTMANLPYYAQDLVKGLVLAGALVVTFSSRRDRR
jgi:simple sugar transport system permease protein